MSEQQASQKAREFATAHAWSETAASHLVPLFEQIDSLAAERDGLKEKLLSQTCRAVHANTRAERAEAEVRELKIELAGFVNRLHRAIFDRTLKLAASYGDNLFHCKGEQADRQFAKVMAEVSEP